MSDDKEQQQQKPKQDYGGRTPQRFNLNTEDSQETPFYYFFTLLCSLTAIFTRNRLFALVGLLFFVAMLCNRKKKDSISQFLPPFTSGMMSCYVTYSESLRLMGVEVGIGAMVGGFVGPLVASVQEFVGELF